jgi:F-type H+-transporting ATPase subunit delta
MAENITIARPYAEALLDLAREKGNLDQWSSMLDLMSQVASAPEMASLFDNPGVEPDQLVEIIGEVGKDTLDDHARNLLRLLAERDRLSILPDIAALYELERSRAEGEVEAEVVSAQPLDESQQAKLAEALKKRLGREVRLTCRTDEELLGGAVVRAGDLVIDGSAVGRLERLAGSLRQ